MNIQDVVNLDVYSVVNYISIICCIILCISVVMGFILVLIPFFVKKEPSKLKYFSYVSVAMVIISAILFLGCTFYSKCILGNRLIEKIDNDIQTIYGIQIEPSSDYKINILNVKETIMEPVESDKGVIYYSIKDGILYLYNQTDDGNYELIRF